MKNPRAVLKALVAANEAVVSLRLELEPLDQEVQEFGDWLVAGGINLTDAEITAAVAAKNIAAKERRLAELKAAMKIAEEALHRARLEWYAAAERLTAEQIRALANRL